MKVSPLTVRGPALPYDYRRAIEQDECPSRGREVTAGMPLDREPIKACPLALKAIGDDAQDASRDLLESERTVSHAMVQYTTCIDSKLCRQRSPSLRAQAYC